MPWDGGEVCGGDMRGVADRNRGGIAFALLLLGKVRQQKAPPIEQ